MVHHRTPTRNQLQYQKTLTQLGTIHIVIGFSCASLQLAQFSNNSILSQTEPGLWCGTIFVLTGAVAIGLASVRGVYASLTILAFCFASLFLALTLCSLSWLGAEAAAWCQYEWEECFVVSNTTVPWNGPFYETDDGPTCDELQDGYCGFSIGIARILHSLMMLLGICQATSTFVLSAVTCNRPNRNPTTRHVPRISIHNITFSTDPDTGFSNGPVTAWEYPPLDKNALGVQDGPCDTNNASKDQPPSYDFIILNAQALPDPEEATSRL